MWSRCAFNLFIFPFQDRTSFAAPPTGSILVATPMRLRFLAVIPAARRWEASKAHADLFFLI